MPEPESAPHNDPPGPPAAVWPAHWITHARSFQEPTGVTLYRRAFELDAVPATYRTRVTADNRFRLFVNGAYVGCGPARGDLMHWRYDTIDITKHLVAGKNVIAAIVWFADYDHSPWAQIGHFPGLLVCGDPCDSASKIVDTPNGWRCVREVGYSLAAPNDMPHGTVVGMGDKLDAAKFPWGWEQIQFDDSGWDHPHVMSNGCPRGARDGSSPWMLTHNLLPPMEETSTPIGAVVRTEGVVVENHRLASDAPVTIPANTKATLLVDNGVLTTGYPELQVEGGAGAHVAMRYSEALWGGPNRNEKGNRNEIEGKVLRGNHDLFLLDGAARTFRPLYWRTFRYLQIEVQTADKPVTLRGLSSVFTGYPFRERGRFASSDESLKPIWDVGWRTARLCAHETYMDCPYYEQLQYGGDTRIQCLVSYYVAGDHRLARNAIAQLDDSRLPEGITQSRYPSHLTQVIPPFSLWWVGMVHDYWMFVDDPEFVRAMLPGARSSVEWFLSRQRSDGLLGPLPWWNFVDWAREFPDGVPSGVVEGGSSILSLQVVLALRELAEMEHTLGRPENARWYRGAAKRIVDAVRAHCLDSWHGLIADTPKKDKFSQHANALAILTDTVTGDEARTVATKILTSPTDKLAQATFYFRFYLHRALRHAGFGDHYIEWLEPWRDMLKIGLTTWAENPEPTRSDCHAWSAHPNADLLATVLGVEPDAPGFARVKITPHLGDLTWVEGSVPHPKGSIVVRLDRDGSGLRGSITLPQGVTGTLRHADRTRPLKSGAQSVVIA